MKTTEILGTGIALPLVTFLAHKFFIDMLGWKFTTFEFGMCLSIGFGIAVMIRLFEIKRKNTGG